MRRLDPDRAIAVDTRRPRPALGTIVAVALVFCAGDLQPAWAEPGAVAVRVVQAISSRPILPDTDFGSLGGEVAIAIRAARGEYEPASFAIHNGSAVDQRIEIEAGELRGPGGVIAAEQIGIKHVLVWYQASGAWSNWRRSPRNMDAHLTPELLVNDPEIIRIDRAAQHNYLRLSRPSGVEYLLISARRPAAGNEYPSVDEQPVYDAATLAPVVIPAGENHQVWVTVHVPEATAPGRYRGAIRVGRRDREFARVPISVEVEEFELPAPSIEYSLYYRGKLADHHPTVSHEWKSSDQLVADLEAMIEHGISNPNCYQRLWPKEGVERASPLSGPESISRVLAIRRDLGLTDRPLYYVGRPTGSSADPEQLAQLAADTRAMLSLARSHGASELYLYGVDEAGGQKLIDQQTAWRTVKALGAKVFTAGYGDHFEKSGGLTDLLVYSDPPFPRGRAVAAQQHAVGNRIHMYGNPQAGPEDPLLWRRSYGIRVWQAGYDGAMPFAFQSQFGSIWNDWDDENYRTEALAYPAADGPISTLAFEGLREAIDDVRYLTALESAIAEVGRRGSSPARQSALHSAEAFLAALRTRVEFDPANVREQLVAHLRALAGSDAVTAAR